MTAPTTEAVRMAVEALKNARVFVQDSLDIGVDRAVIGNLMSARDEIDKALRSLDGGKGFERPESPSGDAGPVARAAPKVGGQ